MSLVDSYLIFFTSIFSCQIDFELSARSGAEHSWCVPNSRSRLCAHHETTKSESARWERTQGWKMSCFFVAFFARFFEVKTMIPSHRAVLIIRHHVHTHMRQSQSRNLELLFQIFFFFKYFAFRCCSGISAYVNAFAKLEERRKKTRIFHLHCSRTFRVLRPPNDNDEDSK